MKGSTKFRLVCMVTLWLLLCYLLVASQPFTLRLAFVIVASGIIVFVPCWKKYVKNSTSRKDDARKR